MKDLTPNALFIGGGIMSSTLAVLYKLLNPNAQILIVERSNEWASESSNAWNNAGTGHAAYCELNYTPISKDGVVDITKAIKIASQFEVSKSFWAYLVSKGYINNSFIKCVPHYSVVFGEKDIQFLEARFNSLKGNYLFSEMEFSKEYATIANWLPLISKERSANDAIAATCMQLGTDIDYGNLTKQLIQYLSTLPNTELYLKHEVRSLAKDDAGNWYVEIYDLEHNETISITAPFVFIGGGGASLPLLQDANINEANGYGGFPVSGQFLRCTNPDIVAQHFAKAYGRAALGAPPMSVPHLDTRFIDGQQELLFGPFAGFSTKFLKQGSYFDLPDSIEFNNMFPMLAAGWHNIPLTKYLIQQVQQSHQDRVNDLRQFIPTAQEHDWELITAGQRVQVIKKDEVDGGKLEFGTELVYAADGSIAALLGASPGASTCVSSMLDVLKKCFPTHIPNWQSQLMEMIPSFGKVLAEHPDLGKRVRAESAAALGLLAK